MSNKPLSPLCFSFFLSAGIALTSHAQLVWEVGLDDNGWPMGDGGGPDTSFVQENASINPLPGSPDSTEEPRGADNDYYFAGSYTKVIPSVVAEYGDYQPVGDVAVNEEAAERAFAAADNDLRYHFNLPATLKTTNLLSITFDALNLQTDQPDPRYGIEVYFNGVKVQSEILIRAAQLGVDYTTPQFTLASVNAQVGPGFDNIVSLKGVNYNNDGGGNWMGIDYVQLNLATNLVPAATFPWQVGTDDNRHISAASPGAGGGTNTTFVQESGTSNPLPGNPSSAETDKQADDDYYLAGAYTTVIPANGTYQPVGTVAVNEEAAERAFAGTDNDLRYHFNLPNSLLPTDRLAVTVDPLDLDTSGADPRYGIEVYFNGVKVQPEVVIRSAQLNKALTTPAFTLASVNAQIGPGYDNIVALKGINHSSEGGGNWMGIDYVKLDRAATAIPAPVLPWFVGQNDNGWPTGNGGGGNASFVQENAQTNALPGNPSSPEVAQQADDDYYLAGIYTTVIPSNGNYTPVGQVPANEEAAERAFAAVDNYLRYHFNLPGTLQPTDQLTVGFDALNLDTSGTDPRYGIEVYFNNVLVQTQLVIRAEQLNQTFFTKPFTLASVNAQPGPGYDNIVTLKGINYNTEGGGNWMGIDFVQLSPVLASPFPWAVGKDDNGWPVGNGGGPNASFVQETGTNPLPGNPANPEVNQQADDDYYFAGDFSKIIPSVVAQGGDYVPVGPVFANEEAAERAFAGSDNTLRYHFNLPDSLKPTDQMLVTFDANNLDTGGTDPHYGIEIYFNEVLVQPEIIIYAADLDKDFTTKPFTLASVNAQPGSGFDNIVTLKGINYNSDGGGNWMGIDYVQLNPMPTPVFPWAVGKDDNGWPLGDGGGPNTSFVQENSSINNLPGSPTSREVSSGADNDYYFAGVYTNTIPSVVAEYGAYEPVGIVPTSEEAAERAFAGNDNDLRYHFNLPASLNLTNQATISFDALNLQDGQPDSRYGIEVYFNGVKVQSQIVIRTNQLGVVQTTAPFTLASVNAKLGLGADNIISLKGINYNADGGGNWMGIDYVQLNPAVTTTVPPAFVLPVVRSGGNITLNWTGAGQLEWAPTVIGPWTPVTPAAASPHTEAILPNQNRFYRLRRQ
ncbi:MAG: hypothetical protein HY735_02220 [Verrucomicrobia bacterium]|nr:hypothetical protein [Verrucomicrobiota bacterium]